MKLRTAAVHTATIEPLFLEVDLPTEKSKPCTVCERLIRNSFTKQGIRVAINDEARPVRLEQQVGHRFGKFPFNQMHAHQAE